MTSLSKYLALIHIYRNGRDTMKILIINPNSDENTDAIMEEKAKNLSLDGVEVDVVHVTRAPKLVCSYEEDVYKRQV